MRRANKSFIPHLHKGDENTDLANDDEPECNPLTIISVLWWLLYLFYPCNSTVYESYLRCGLLFWISASICHCLSSIKISVCSKWNSCILHSMYYIVLKNLATFPVLKNTNPRFIFNIVSDLYCTFGHPAIYIKTCILFFFSLQHIQYRTFCLNTFNQACCFDKQQ